MAKRFFYVCAGLLMLALSYHLGARSAGAQAPGNPVAGVAHDAGSALFVVTANGDTYVSLEGTGWQRKDNVFSAPTPAQPTTFGALKARFRR